MQAALGSPREQTERAALREELRQAKAVISSWHDSWKQAKHACDAWKREAEDATNKLRSEREGAARRIDELERRLRDTEAKLQALQTQAPVRTLVENIEISRLPLSSLEQLQHQLRFDLERIDSVRVDYMLVHNCSHIYKHTHTHTHTHRIFDTEQRFVLNVKNFHAVSSHSLATTVSCVKRVLIKWEVKQCAPIAMSVLPSALQ